MKVRMSCNSILPDNDNMESLVFQTDLNDALSLGILKIIREFAIIFVT